MSYKIIFTDLDDTLLNSEKKISHIDKEAILKAQEVGVKFVLASGRPTFAMYDLAKELELEKYESFILSFNGSIITECRNGKNIFEASLTKDDLHLIYDFAKENNCHILTYLDNEIVSETESEYIDVEVNLTKMPHKVVKSFKETVDRPAVKCMLLEEPSYLKEVEKRLKEKYGDKYSIAISKPFFLEITKLGVDKGVALKNLVETLGIKIEESIAVGDSYNDLPMLKAAGLAACVENANEDIKKVCSFISKSNNNGGMAYLIEKLIFDK